jgi:signal transduction histidine kinase
MSAGVAGGARGAFTAHIGGGPRRTHAGVRLHCGRPVGVVVGRSRLFVGYLIVQGAALLGLLFVAPYEGPHVHSWPHVLWRLGSGWIAAAAVIVGLRLFRPPTPAPWLLFAVARFLNTAGVLMERVAEPAGGGVQLADVLWLAEYPATALGLALLIRKRSPGDDRVALADTATMTTGLALLGWIFIIHPQIAGSFALSELLARVAYPVLDLVLLALMVRLLLAGANSNQALRLMILSVLCSLGPDIAWALPLPVFPPEIQLLLVITCVAGAALTGAAALHPSVADVERSPGPLTMRLTRRLLAGLALASLIAPALLLYEALSGDLRNGAAIAVSSAILFLLVVGRMVHLLRRVQERTRELADSNEALRAEKQIKEGFIARERQRLAAEQDLRADLHRSNVELHRAVRMKDEFLANMSHELRTPLNAILAMAEALQEGAYGGLPEAQRDCMTLVQSSGKHLLALINDVLDLAKIGAGTLELRPETLDVGAVCQGALQSVQELAAHKQIRVDQRLEHETRPDVAAERQPDIQPFLADPRRLRQMLVNLLSNAVKFTPVGGEIGLQARFDPVARHLLLTVWDTGPGIRPEAAEQLFKPFVQLDSGLARRHEGTGLGLALVHRLAALHGGEVFLEDRPGGGSQFTIRLPGPAEAPVGAAAG